MTFREIEYALPNGFHDCEIVEIHMDCLTQVMNITVLADIRTTQGGGYPTYRKGVLSATGVGLFFLEHPNGLSPFILRGKGVLAVGDSDFNGLSQKVEDVMERLPPEMDRYRFFLENWNSFLYIFARDATFEWAEPELP